ncbi:reverse transcriptase domain-containing protein [Tanacetum coccineum]
MADNRTMAQMLQAPIEGYEDAIVTSTFRHPEVPNTSIKLLLFPFSLEGEARTWLDKEPPRSILTWDDLVSKFINQFFPPSKTTYLRNEITTFYQKPNETFNEAWERFKGLLRQCPHHGFSELHQLDTFYNSLNTNDQDALDSAAGGNFLDKMPRDGLAIIESKSKVRYSRSRAIEPRVSTNAPLSTSTPSNSFEFQQLAASLEDKMDIRMSRLEKMISEKNVTTPATVKAVEEVCVTCGSNHNFNNCPLTRNEFPVFHDNIHQFQQTAAVGNFVQRNPPNLANQMRPPGFNQPNVQNNQGNQSRYQGNNFNSNQNRGGNFNQNRQNNQGAVYQTPPYQPPTNQPLVNQALPSTSQIQSVSKTDFESYAKANDANMNNLQMKLDNFQRNQNDFQRSYNDSQKKQDDFQNMMLGFMQNYHNNSTASTSRSGTLPSQTVTNPREHVNAITTRSGKTLEGPSTPLVPTPVVSIPSKEPEQNPETSTEKVQNPNLENTAQVPPPEEEESIFMEIPKPKAKKTVNVEIQDLNSPRPNSYPSKLPYPERMKVRENDKPSAQHSRFLKMFKQLRLEIGLNEFPVFHDNIHQFQQTAAVGNFVQRNPPNLANQMRPPGFNQPNVQNNQGNQSRYQGNNFNSNQNRGNNFNQNHQNNQGQVFQPPTNQPPVYQVPPYQAPTPQIQGVSKTDFENYVKANDAVLKNVQNQGQNLQNQMANVTSLLTNICNNFKDSACTSNLGTLPSQTVTNPRQQINAITTRSGKTLEGPPTPLVPTPIDSIPSKEPEQNPETSTKKVQNPNLENTAHVPPSEEEESIFIEIPKP